MNKFFSNIIVTGSEGFIGKHLVAYLQSLGITVWCVDKKINIPITEVENILSQHKIDAVIHLAAQSSVFGDDKNSMVDDNIKAFINVCDACKKHNVKFVYASSVFADKDNISSLYGLTKHFDEEYAKLHNSNAVGIRFCNVYDMECFHEGSLIWHIINDSNLVLYNNGNNVRHFTCLDNVVKCIYKSLTETENIVNCVNPNSMTIKEFTDMVLKYHKISKAYTCEPTTREFDSPTQFIDFSLKNIYE